MAAGLCRWRAGLQPLASTTGLDGEAVRQPQPRMYSSCLLVPHSPFLQKCRKARFAAASLFRFSPGHPCMQRHLGLLLERLYLGAFSPVGPSISACPCLLPDPSLGFRRWAECAEPQARAHRGTAHTQGAAHGGVQVRCARRRVAWRGQGFLGVQVRERKGGLEGLGILGSTNARDFQPLGPTVARPSHGACVRAAIPGDAQGGEVIEGS